MRRYRDRGSLDFFSWKLFENGGWLNWQWEEGANCLVSARLVWETERPLVVLLEPAAWVSRRMKCLSDLNSYSYLILWPPSPVPICQLLTPIKILNQDFSIASTSDIAGSWKWRQLVSNLGQPRSSRRIAMMTLTIDKSCNPGLKNMENMGNLKNMGN